MLDFVSINETSLQLLKDPCGKNDLNIAKPVYFSVTEIKFSTSFNLPVSDIQASGTDHRFIFTSSCPFMKPHQR